MAGKRQRFTGSLVSIALALGLVLSLLLVFLFRNPEAMLPGTESYFLVRAASDFSFQDSLSFGGRFAAYPIGARALLSVTPEIMFPVIPIILGALSFIFFMLLLKEFGIKPKKLALAILIASPSFIFLFNSLNTASFAICLLLLAFLLFAKKSSARFIAIPLFAIIPLFDFTIGIFAIILLFLFAFFMQKEKKLLFLFAFILTLAVSGSYYIWLIIKTGFEWLKFEAGATGFNAALSSFVSDLGAMHGIGIFALILAVFGIISHWEVKYKNLFVFFSMAMLFASGFFIPKAQLLLNFFIAVFAAYGFMNIYESKWENKVFRNFVLLILACGLLFSALSYAQRFTAEEPSPAIIKGIEYLKSLPDGVVFSHYTRGNWISFAGKQNVMDENMWLAPEVNRRWSDSQELLYTRDFEKAKEIINKYGIKYIWLDAQMKQTLWKEDEEGLLFLLMYSKSYFRLAYGREGVQIWEVIG